jgi:hypothetical protein
MIVPMSDLTTIPDTFVAAVPYADGGPARPWWEFSRERKAREHA